MRMKPEHMRLIAPEININYDKDLLHHVWTEKKGILEDETFCMQDGRYLPDKLLLTGLMYCQYDDPEQHIKKPRYQPRTRKGSR